MILRKLPFFSIPLIVAASAVLAQVPSTDIFLLSVDGGTVSDIRRVTDREGYDNQPRFLPDGRRLVYSSMAPDGTNIREFDLRTGESRGLVDTDESLYSPTPVPGKDAISVVRDYRSISVRRWAVTEAVWWRSWRAQDDNS